MWPRDACVVDRKTQRISAMRYSKGLWCRPPFNSDSFEISARYVSTNKTSSDSVLNWLIGFGKLVQKDKNMRAWKSKLVICIVIKNDMKAAKWFPFQKHFQNLNFSKYSERNKHGMFSEKIHKNFQESILDALSYWYVLFAHGNWVISFWMILFQRCLPGHWHKNSLLFTNATHKKTTTHVYAKCWRLLLHKK